MTLEQLRIFVAVTQRQHFTQAAHDLRLTQSAISAAVTALESLGLSELLGINFAMGVATGLTMEFQFGTNWAYYSHYVGDIFGAPLAIGGLMAFFLEATFIGLFFFGWRSNAHRRHGPRPKIRQ